jgi:predicted Zn-dependent protease
MEKEERSLKKQGGEASDSGIRRTLGGRALVATVLIFIALAAVIWFARQNSSPTSPEAFFSPHPNTYIKLEKDGTASEKLLMEAFQAYEDGAYQKAFDLFRQLASPSDPYRYNDLLFYRANTLIALNRSAEAIPMLELIIQVNETSHLTSAKWFLALAYLMNDQETKAKPLLEEVAKTPAYKGKAEKLLASLSK